MNEHEKAEEKYNDLLETVKKVRKEKGISQAEMAAMLGIAQANYSKIERQVNKANAVQIMAILDYLGIKGLETDNSITELTVIGSPEEIQRQLNQQGEDIASLRREVQRLQNIEEMVRQMHSQMMKNEEGEQPES